MHASYENKELSISAEIVSIFLYKSDIIRHKSADTIMLYINYNNIILGYVSTIQFRNLLTILRIYL